MRLASIELSGYTRLMHGLFGIFKMDLTQKIHLILGTNGTGKSSLLSELTPLPANGDDFVKGGSKTITIYHRGSTYVLVNRFDTKKGWHSFTKDGEELNASHLQTTQYELCQQVFSYNDQVRALLQGKLRFTEMGPKQRREWMTLLSDVDFDFALMVYDKILKQQSAARGFLKVQRGRLVTEQHKIISVEEQNRLKKETEEIHRQLSELLAVRKPIEHDKDQLEASHRRGLSELDQMSLTLMRMRLHQPVAVYGEGEASRDDWGVLQMPHFTSLEHIDTYLDVLKQRMSGEQALLNQAVKDHGKIQETLKVLKQTGDDGMKSLSEKHQQLINDRSAVLAKRKYALDFGDNRQAMVALEACRDLLIDIFSQLPENEDKRFSTANREKYLGDRKSLQDTIHNYKGSLDRLGAQKSHQEQHLAAGQVECPECRHKFAPGFSQKKLDELSATIERGTVKLGEVNTKLKGVEELLEEIDAYGALYRQYAACIKGYPALAALWSYLSVENIPLSAPRMVVTLVDAIHRDLKLELEADEIVKKMDETKQLMHQATLVGNATLSETQEKAAEIEATIEAMTSHMRSMKIRHADCLRFYREMEEAYTLGNKIDKLQKDLTQVTAQIVDTMWMETIHHCVRQLQSTLTRKEEALNEVKEQIRRVKDLEAQIAQEEKREKALGVLVETMSPKDGMIAEGLLGFIKNYVRHMNSVIRKVWSYPLNVLPCGMADGNGIELDYKFPMLVNGTEPRKDVSEGSTGMQSMVDLAFQRVAMKYLGIEESPFYLDEFSKSLDHEHKKSAMLAVKVFMETSPLTQLFMISHDYHQYSSFTNIATCVLDAKNIVAPDSYNEHVTIQ